MPIDLASGAIVTVRPPRPVAIAPQPGLQVLVTSPGPHGPVGPPGPSGGEPITHVQSSPSSQWSIPWTRRATPPAVDVWVGGALVLADVDASTPTTVLVTFPAPTSGYAVLT